MKVTRKQAEIIGGAVISSYINLFYLNEAKASGLFKHKVLQNVNRTTTDLIGIEKEMFDKIEGTDDDDLGGKLVSNHIEFVDWLLNHYSYSNFTKLQEVCAAFTINPNRLTRISDKILKENGATR